MPEEDSMNMITAVFALHFAPPLMQATRLQELTRELVTTSRKCQTLLQHLLG
jgi:hypothetical protein